MSEYYGHFDAVAGSPNYPGATFALFVDLLSKDIVPGYLNELEVTQDTGLQTVLDSGGMISRGYFYVQNEAADGASPKVMTHDAESAGYKRKDLVVIEFDTSTGTNAAKIHKGISTTETPTAPDLIDTSTLWEELVSIVTVEGGVVTAVEDARTISGARRKIATGEIGSNEIANGAVGTDQLGTVQSVTCADGVTLEWDNVNKIFVLNVTGCEAVYLAPIIVGTGDEPPAGTYPKWTQYIQEEVAE